MLINYLYFLFVFVLISLVYILFINRRRLKKNNYKLIGEINYLVAKFKLDPKKIKLKSMLYATAFINAFIIAFVCMVIYIIPLKMVWQLLIGFVLLFALIYSIYEIYGSTLIKKGWGKDAKK